MEANLYDKNGCWKFIMVSIIKWVINNVDNCIWNTLCVSNTFITLVDAITDKSLANTYFIQKISNNRNCGVLYKTFSQFYVYSNYTGFLGTSGTYHNWFDTPWNYQNPAPCRVLVNTYPYSWHNNSMLYVLN